MSVRSPIEPQIGGPPPPGPTPPERTHRGRWPVILILGALVAAVVLVGGAIAWSSRDTAETKGPPIGSQSSALRPAPPTTPTTADPQAATKAEVIAAYRASWDEQLAVGRDPNATADDDRLRAHRTGNALATLQLSLVKHKARNEIYVGNVTVHPTVVDLGSDTATIRDCLDDATGTAIAATGEIVEPPTRVVTTLTVTMKLVGPVWKQSNYQDEKVSCTPAAS